MKQTDKKPLVTKKILFLIIPILIIGILALCFVVGNKKNAEQEIKHATEVLIPNTLAKVLDVNTYKIKSIQNVINKGSIYSFVLILENKDGQSFHYLSYISNDGKFFFPEGIDLDRLEKKDKEATPSAVQK